MFNRNKIQEFYKLNGIRITGILNKVNGLQAHYFQRNEQGQLIPDPEMKHPKLNEGMVYEDYIKEYNEYMTTKSLIVI